MMHFDDTDHALIAAAHAGDHSGLLALADKKQEEGHEDFAHLLRAGVNHGSVATGSHGVPPGGPTHAGFHWDHDETPHRGLLRVWSSDGSVLRVSVPTHHPEIREMAARHGGVAAPDGEHWQGTRPLWLTTPEELDALRAAHRNPTPNKSLHVAHGPGGMYSVGVSGKTVYSHLPTGETEGLFGRHETPEAALAHANRLAHPEQPERLSRDSELPIGDLRPDRENMEIAVDSLHRGMGSVTPGGVKVTLPDGDGKYHVIDGHHRLLEAILSGKTHVPVTHSGQPASGTRANRSVDLDPDDEHFGLRDSLPRNGWLLGRLRMSRAAQMQSGNMKARLRLAAHVLSEAGVTGTPLPVLAHDAASGTRPDVMVASETAVHPALLRYLAAHHGLLNSTPSVVAFNATPHGRDTVHVIASGLERPEALQTLQAAGVPRFIMHKNTVYVYDEGSQLNLHPVLGALRASSYHAIPGVGHVVGAGEGAAPDEQRAHYRDTIRAAESAAGSVPRQPEVTPAAGVRLSRRVPTVYGRHTFVPHPSLVEALASAGTPAFSSRAVFDAIAASVPHDHPIGEWFKRMATPPGLALYPRAVHDPNDSAIRDEVQRTLEKRGLPRSDAYRAAVDRTSKAAASASLSPGGAYFSVRAAGGGYHTFGVSSHVPSETGTAGRDFDLSHRMAVAAKTKLGRGRRPDTILAHGGVWKLPDASVDALYQHAAGTHPLTEEEIVRHVTNNPHPAAGRIAQLPRLAHPFVTARSAVAVRQPYSREAREVMYGDPKLRDGYDWDREVYHSPAFRISGPGVIDHQPHATDVHVYHKPSDSYVNVQIDHPGETPYELLPELDRQVRRAKQNLMRPVVAHYVKNYVKEPR